MRRELIVRPDAEAELLESAQWYEERAEGLGAEFLRTLDAAFESIVRDPLRYPLVRTTMRRAVLRRFPYSVFFVVEDTRIVVTAVFHAKRDPKRWQDRT